MLYDYRCPACDIVTEIREKPFSSPSNPVCPQCELNIMQRKPHNKWVAQFKASGFTRTSTTPDVGRKLSPWFGGPKSNSPDYEATQEYENSKRKLDEKGGTPSDYAKLNTDLERDSISAMQTAYGRDTYPQEDVDRYISTNPNP